MYAYVDEAELPKQLADGDVKEVPRKLVDSANAGGGHDNITAVVIRVGETASTALAPRTTEVSLKLEVLRGCRCSATSPTRSWCVSRRSPR
jgi:serine/threonine protein phosphatase PrpC